MSLPEFWIIAGPNGAGKTTCVSRQPFSLILPHITFLNPDERTLEKLRSLGFAGFQDAPADVQSRCFLESADAVFAELKEAIDDDRSVGVETVLSTGKYRPLVEEVTEVGGFVGLIYITLSSPALAKERVAARVRRGGHGIPDEKIEQRWKRSLDCLAWFCARVTAFWIIDNSDSDPAHVPHLLARGRNGKLEFLEETAFPELKAALDYFRQI